MNPVNSQTYYLLKVDRGKSKIELLNEERLYMTFLFSYKWDKSSVYAFGVVDQPIVSTHDPSVAAAVSSPADKLAAIAAFSGPGFQFFLLAAPESEAAVESGNSTTALSAAVDPAAVAQHTLTHQ